MKRLLSARGFGGMAIALLLGVALLPTAAFGGSDTSHETLPWEPQLNQEGFWVEYGRANFGETWQCIKDDRGGSGEYQVPAPPEGWTWRLLVIKAGSEYVDLWHYPTPGAWYEHTGKGGWSWAMLCKVEDPVSPTTTEPTVPPTEPTVPPTEPTVPPTEPTVPPTEPTTPPTEPATDPTETIEAPEVAEETSTTPPVTDEEDPEGETDGTLPFTGIDSGAVAMGGLLALLAGGALIAIAQRRAED